MFGLTTGSIKPNIHFWSSTSISRAVLIPCCNRHREQTRARKPTLYDTQSQQSHLYLSSQYSARPNKSDILLKRLLKLQNAQIWKALVDQPSLFYGSSSISSSFPSMPFHSVPPSHLYLLRTCLDASSRGNSIRLHP